MFPFFSFYIVLKVKRVASKIYVPKDWQLFIKMVLANIVGKYKMLLKKDEHIICVTGLNNVMLLQRNQAKVVV